MNPEGETWLGYGSSEETQKEVCVYAYTEVMEKNKARMTGYQKADIIGTYFAKMGEYCPGSGRVAGEEIEKGQMKEGYFMKLHLIRKEKTTKDSEYHYLIPEIPEIKAYTNYKSRIDKAIWCVEGKNT